MRKVRKKVNNKKGKVWERPFVYLSITCIVIIVAIYAYRLFHYHYEFNHIEPAAKFIDIISNKKNIVYHGDGLYKEDDGYYYYGKDVNNYLTYEGLLWRIIAIDDKYIKLITDENLTNLVWGNNNTYNDSIINKWLNKDGFMNSIINSDKVLDTSWCNKAINLNKYECIETTNGKVGLITTQEYLKAGGDKSYLNNKSYFWTINTSNDNKAYYIHSEGGINNDIGNDTSLYSYGIRPVINIASSSDYISGDGSLNKPYVIANTMITTLKTAPVGSYIKYNDYQFRVSMQGDDYTKLIYDGYLKNNNEAIKVTYDNINSYIKNNFMKEFNEAD